jgi:hypothetical protein
MYSDVDLSKGKAAALFKPIQIFRSGLFVLIPLAVSHSAIQTQLLMFLCLFYVMYYGYVRPETGGKQVYVIEIFNNFALLMATYTLLLFTDFVPDFNMRFQLGYCFVLIAAAVLIVNLLRAVYNMLQRFCR